MLNQKVFQEKKLLGLTLSALFLIGLTVKADTVEVNIQGFAFNPDSLKVSMGTIIRWTNLDAASHTSTSDVGLWDSGTLNSNDQYLRVFDSAGSFPYHCAIHPSMTAKIIVYRQSVPSLTVYGLAVLALLVIISGVWVLHNKKKIAELKK